MPNDCMPKIVLISVSLCVVCSFFVALSAISLKDLQMQNKLDEKRMNIMQVAQLQDKEGSLDQIFSKYIESRLVDIENGTFSDRFDPENFDVLASREDPGLSRTLTTAEDRAKIKVRENFAVVYLVKNDAGEYSNVIIPIRGYGLWSTLYGFMAVSIADGNTINGLQFYDQAETPGLGAEVDNPRWRGLWPGKKIYQDGTVKISVKKGNHNGNAYAVDALSGASLTSNGVNNLVQFWTGPLGFQSLLQKLPQSLS
ncbi:MAG: Na(+)-translocating NADH-quinone reductase subunit C [Alphaproteobacteria bacterium]|nr:Na(+)-translocating NADH-quinone reductase subunit C [Alphaproteobacteria bacterium]